MMNQLPDQVSSFLLEFNRAFREQKWAIVAEKLEDFNALSNLFYSNSRWPTSETVREFYRHNGCHHEVVVLLYTELAMRHMFTNVSNSVRISDRSDSFDNYEALFQLMIDEICESNNAQLPIPTKWLWNMMDEFVYQYHDTQQYKVKIVNQTNSIERLDNDFVETYDPVTVKGWLMSFIEKSKITQFLKNASWNTEYTQREHLGYFALIALARLHTISGDFYSALLVASSLPISARAFYWKIPSANASFFYHLGVAYIMLGRYIDAVKAMTPLLVFVSKSSMYLGKSSSYELRTIDRMYYLMKIAEMVSPAQLVLDDGIFSVMKDHNNDKWTRLQGDDDGTFVAVFHRSMPKFVPAFRLKCVCDERLDIFSHSLSQQLLDQLLDKRRLSDYATSIKTSARLYNVLPIDKLTQLIFDDYCAQKIDECEALTAHVKSVCIQNVNIHPEDLSDSRPRQFKTEQVLVSSEYANFRIDHLDSISVCKSKLSEDRLQNLGKSIAQTNELLDQLRKIQIREVPATFSLDGGEPVHMQRVKRGEDNKKMKNGGGYQKMGQRVN
eukprot:GHVH01010828.1.p1 GENE.GHVH01010828.1~~GHVH01010828.1.p1  ORF type:complete len:555 (+),score=93.39 GHVH01010828.1:234-1898(+)